MRAIHYRYADIGGQQLFYREAGPPGASAVVLLHGFPASSFMFRDLTPLLAVWGANDLRPRGRPRLRRRPDRRRDPPPRRRPLPARKPPRHRGRLHPPLPRKGGVMTENLKDQALLVIGRGSGLAQTVQLPCSHRTKETHPTERNV